ncbi:hypothetical protein [Aquipuribacter hungaricus]|uniref:Uncharacterized protein n=1 Tax=Aquipuribacter hungaricus TaxID=545624 RepID=A0ABV7WCS3_9MICO
MTYLDRLRSQVVAAELRAVAVHADPESLQSEVRRARDRLSLARGVLLIAEADPQLRDLTTRPEAG